MGVCVRLSLFYVSLQCKWFRAVVDMASCCVRCVASKRQAMHMELCIVFVLVEFLLVWQCQAMYFCAFPH